MSGRLRLEGIAMVGKTTIYNWLHADKRSGGDLYSYCRHGLKYRRKRLSTPCNSKKRGRYKSILDRPETIDEQGRMGDMEMDLILGASGSEAILTLTDRKTDYIFLEALPHGRKAKPIARAVNSRLAVLKRRGQLHSITTDNGPEFSAFRSIERGLGVPVSFARPYRSTDKPHIEHANALIRQYLPKHSSFEGLTKGDLNEIEWRLNNRPRKKLGYRTRPTKYFT
ncbi:MAG: IS30 family transposase [Porphyromonadaceae bacterium]|nr:IS30 family transposase [Porphyromonadaceae bacterium]